MNKSSVLGLLFAVALLVSSQTTYAYSDVNHKHTAVRVTNSHIIFTIDFRMGFLNRATTLPLLATTNRLATNQIIYSILNQNNEVVVANSKAILLTPGTPVKAAQYLIPYGQTAQMTFLAIAEAPKNGDEYHLVINSFPYSISDTNSNTTFATIKEERLTAFTSPKVK